MEKVKTNTVQLAFWEFIKEHGSSFNSAIDIGCYEGQFIFSLEQFGYLKLYGIDLWTINWELKYVGIRTKQNEEKGIKQTEDELREAYKKKFKIQPFDYKNYTFQNYDCIVCKNLVHMLPYDEQIPMIDLVYTHLEPGGIALIQVNTYEGIVNNNPDGFEEIAPRVIKSTKSDKTMYLQSREEIEKEILKYNWSIVKSFPTDIDAVCLFLKK